jgi:protein TonB
MARIAIVACKPKPGKAQALKELTRTQVPRLRDEGLVTSSQAIIMEAADGTIAEVFEHPPLFNGRIQQCAGFIVVASEISAKDTSKEIYQLIMKFKFITILGILGFCSMAHSALAGVQKDTTGKSAVVAAPKEVLPEFPGGQEKLAAFIKSNLHPVKGASGKKIMVYFVVEKTGKLNHVKVIKGFTPEANKEAVRVIKKSPKWKPGSQNGIVRRATFVTPVVFS